MDRNELYFSIYANGEPILINQRQFVPIEELDAFIDKKFEHLFKVPFTWENYETGIVPRTKV